MATSAPSHPQTATAEPLVKFAENLGLRRFVLNRPEKLNTLNIEMLNQLGPAVAHWEQAEMASVIVGSGTGRAFCAGGDVATITGDLDSESGRQKAIEFFRREFGLDYFLALLTTPYVAVMDGITFGGGFGLAAPATFRVATEKTMIAMPETKIGYFPDVGASYYLSRLDGEIGTYLALTGDAVKGRTAFELGLATHYIPSNRVPLLYERMAALEDPIFEQVAYSIDELYSEREPTDSPPQYVGALREALDDAFSRNTVEDIIGRLRHFAAGTTSGSNVDVVQWAKSALTMIEDRSPTSLRIALKAIRKGKKMSLLEAFYMELRLVSVFCSGGVPDFATGVSAVLKEKLKTRPAWSPAALAEVSDAEVEEKFFRAQGADIPQLVVPDVAADRYPEDPMIFALPTEERIRRLVTGEAEGSTGMALTLEELLNQVDSITNYKPGAREKAQEIAGRKCALDDGKYLRWK